MPVVRKKRRSYYLKYKGYLRRGFCILFAGLILNFVFLFSGDILSWFNGTRSAGWQVKAASTENVFEYVTLLKTNPQEIKIKKADTYYKDLVVFFALEGEAAGYLAHLNPVKLDSHEEISIPLLPQVELPQFIKLINNADQVSGTLTIKYMPEYIEESLSFSYSSEYLLGCFINSLQGDGNNVAGNEQKGIALSLTSAHSEYQHLLHYVIDQTGREAVVQILAERRNKQG